MLESPVNKMADEATLYSGSGLSFLDAAALFLEHGHEADQQDVIRELTKMLGTLGFGTADALMSTEIISKLMRLLEVGSWETQSALVDLFSSMILNPTTSDYRFDMLLCEYNLLEALPHILSTRAGEVDVEVKIRVMEIMQVYVTRRPHVAELFYHDGPLRMSMELFAYPDIVGHYALAFLQFVDQYQTCMQEISLDRLTL